MKDKLVEDLAAQAVRRIAHAKQELIARMRELGLDPASGWRISEELRHTINGTEWIFRPVHVREPSPELFTSVEIDHSGRPAE